MKIRELKQMLKEFDCFFLREGRNHEIWFSPRTKRELQLPRHKKELKQGTVASILKEAGIERRS